MQVITTDKITTMVTYNLVKNALDQEERERERRIDDGGHVSGG